jgi:aspartate-semialdehyde dehydrogenase
VLEQRKFPVGELVPFASARSDGKALRYAGREFRCRALKPGCFEGIDIVFFDASDAVSKEWVKSAAEAGAWVVDNSATHRMDQDIPLIVPEVNAARIEERIRKGAKAVSVRERIIAGPNCTTVQLVVALKPLRDRFGLKRLVLSTYQSVSGAGTAAMDELSEQTAEVLAGKSARPKVFPHAIAFNCIPHIGGFKDDGYTSEEQKLMAETRKILELPNLRISATAVRVPTLACHGESVNIETEKPCSPEEARAALAQQSGVVVEDEPGHNLYPMGVKGVGQDAVYVGRIRKDSSVENGLNLWVVSDNLRKGAALNAVQVGEILVGVAR